MVRSALSGDDVTRRTKDVSARRTVPGPGGRALCVTDMMIDVTFE
jgi:hypothetical protein